MVGSHEVLGGTTHGNWSDFKNWEDVFEVFLGFMNSTQITYGENRTVCQFALEGIYSSAINATNVMTREDPINWFDFWLAIDMYLQIPYNLHAVYWSCYQGALEIYDLFKEYSEFVTNLDILYFNMAYHAG